MKYKNKIQIGFLFRNYRLKGGFYVKDKKVYIISSLHKLIANTDYAAQQNCKLNLEQFAWAFIARHCLLT